MCLTGIVIWHCILVRILQRRANGRLMHINKDLHHMTMELRRSEISSQKPGGPRQSMSNLIGSLIGRQNWKVMCRLNLKTGKLKTQEKSMVWSKLRGRKDPCSSSNVWQRDFCLPLSLNCSIQSFTGWVRPTHTGEGYPLDSVSQVKC